VTTLLQIVTYLPAVNFSNG